MKTWRLPSPARAARSLVLWWRCSLRRRSRLVIFAQPMSRAEIGLFGENLAVRWLRKHRRKVLYRNFAGPKGGEVDIVCRHRDTLAFVEVKTRTSEKFGRPADAVDADKQRLIQRGANEWLRMLHRPVLSFRFDIVEVILAEGENPVVRVVEDAFQMPQGNMLGRVAAK